MCWCTAGPLLVGKWFYGLCTLYNGSVSCLWERMKSDINDNGLALRQTRLPCMNTGYVGGRTGESGGPGGTP